MCNKNVVYADWETRGFNQAYSLGMKFPPFVEAREYVHKLGLKNEKMWREYRKSGNKPADISAILIGHTRKKESLGLISLYMKNSRVSSYSRKSALRYLLPFNFSLYKK
jgi:hypothetical protein